MKSNGLSKRFNRKAVELLSERLLLVPFEKNDLRLLHQTFCNPFVRKYLWDDEEISKETAREILRKNILHFENDGWGLWKALVKFKRLFIGFAGLWTFFDEDRPQLLYGLLPEFTGKGYATEASQAVADYAFINLGFPDLTASFDFGHLQSEKVCQRLKMTWWKEEVLEGKRTVFYRKNNPKQSMDSRPAAT